MHTVLFFPSCLTHYAVSLSMFVYLFFWHLWFPFGLWLQSTVECWRRPKETVSEGEVCLPAGLFVSFVSSHSRPLPPTIPPPCSAFGLDESVCVFAFSPSGHSIQGSSPSRTDHPIKRFSSASVCDLTHAMPPTGYQIGKMAVRHFPSGHLRVCSKKKKIEYFSH